MNVTDSAIHEQMQSAADLMQVVLQTVAQDDPGGAQLVANAYRAGAMLQLRSTVAASGLACLAVELIEPNGSTHTLTQCELQREVTQ